jgi:mRNA interferase HicA
MARKGGLEVTLDTSHGTGSHATLCLGDLATIVKDRRKELGKGLLADMLRQLGIDPKEF